MAQRFGAFLIMKIKTPLIHFGNECRVRCDNRNGGLWWGRCTLELSLSDVSGFASMISIF
jgi:hypothetical protein